MNDFVKYFTVAEAEELLPEITEIFEKVEQVTKSLGLRKDEVEPIIKAAGKNGGGARAAGYLSDILAINNLINRLLSQGILIKDINAGLVDFPHFRDGRVVFLCWKRGESHINYWHEIDAGFAGRQKL